MSHICDKEREIDLIHRDTDLIFKKLEKMDQKLDNLNSWMMKVVGGSIVVVFIISLMFKTKLF